MRVVLHSIERRGGGIIDLVISFGNTEPKRYSASFDGSDENFTFGGTDEELFFALSDTAHKRFGNCAVYQMELMGILGAFDRGEKLPQMSVQLGTTPFGCEFRPGYWRIVWNKLTILLYKIDILHRKVWVHPDYRREA